MPPSRFSKTLLLIDHAQVSIEERNRLLLFGSKPSLEEDNEVIRDLVALKKELHEYDASIKPGDTTEAANFNKVVVGYQKLLDQLSKDESIRAADYVYTTSKDNQENNKDNDTHSETSTGNKLSDSKHTKVVRFKDKLVEDPPAQFVPYRDNPEEELRDDLRDESDLYRENQELMETQDKRLDRLATSVGRQHQLSIQIDDELSTHLDLLDDVDRLADHSTTRLELAKKRLEVFSRRAKQNGSWVTIGILFLIFIVLVLVLK